MALTQQRMRPGAWYRVEADGAILGEFEAKRGRTVTIEGSGGGGSVFLIALPGNYDPATMRDTYSARPPAPGGGFRKKGADRWEPASWSWLLAQPRGIYYARFEGLGDFRIELDPEE